MNGRTASVGFAVSLTLALVLIACDTLFPHRSEGEKLWRKYCADCHGLDAAGNTPRFMGNAYADLTDNLWKDCSGDDSSIEQLIHDGVFGEMPELPDLTYEQRKAIVGYLRVLRHEKKPEAVP
ncbi:MAG TPA: c-type cytochrome [Thermoanaerobaculia bacterium]|nr:c-type cytochrome [Thermoanaerobaculia bacterium]